MNDFDLNPGVAVTVVPTVAIVDVERLRRQCKIDHLSEDDDLKDWAETATQMVERDARLLLRPTSCRLVLDRFPCGRNPIYLPRLPVTSVTAVTYIASDGTETTWVAERYTVALTSPPLRVSPAFGESYPACRGQSEAVKVDFVGGYPDGQAPGLARQAVLLLVGHWYINRELVGDIPKEIEGNYRSYIRRLEWSAP